MSTFSHSQDEERGKQPAREAPGSRAKFRVNGTTARMTNPIPGIRRMADSVALRHQRHENQGNVRARGCKKTQLRHHALYFLFDITTGGIKWRFIRKG